MNVKHNIYNYAYIRIYIQWTQNNKNEKMHIKTKTKIRNEKYYMCIYIYKQNDAY